MTENCKQSGNPLNELAQIKIEQGRHKNSGLIFNTCRITVESCLPNPPDVFWFFLPLSQKMLRKTTVEKHRALVGNMSFGLFVSALSTFIVPYECWSSLCSSGYLETEEASGSCALSPGWNKDIGVVMVCMFQPSWLESCGVRTAPPCNITKIPSRWWRNVSHHCISPWNEETGSLHLRFSLCLCSTWMLCYQGTKYDTKQWEVVSFIRKIWPKMCGVVHMLGRGEESYMSTEECFQGCVFMYR